MISLPVWRYVVDELPMWLRRQAEVSARRTFLHISHSYRIYHPSSLLPPSPPLNDNGYVEYSVTVMRPELSFLGRSGHLTRGNILPMRRYLATFVYSYASDGFSVS